MNFLKSMSSNLYEDYTEARKFCFKLPEYSLIKLRSYASQFVDQLFTNFNIESKSNNLYNKIHHQNFQQVIPQSIRNKLNYLRLAGNKGAHPEEFSLSFEEMKKLACEALEKSYKLSIWLSEQTKKENVKICTFSLPEEHTLEELCHKAIFENDKDAQYTVGRKLEIEIEIEFEKHIENQENKSGIYLFPKWKYDDVTYWYKKCCTRKPVAMYRLGMIYLSELCTQNEPMTEALQILKSAAYDDGFAEAQYYVGVFYFNGEKGCEKNINEALKWLDMAVEQEHLETLTFLADIYLHGREVAKNEKIAFEYACKAAQSGYPSGQYQLGYCYEKGLGTKQDLQQAFELYKKSALGNNAKAHVALIDFYLQKPNKDISKANDCVKFVEKQHDPEALYQLGLLYKKGKVFKKDLLKAFDCFIRCYRLDLNRTYISESAKKQVVIVNKLLLEEFYAPNISIERKNQIMLAIESSIDKHGNIHDFAGMIEWGEKMWNLADNLKISAKPKKMKRNDPCYCGSGKKYKRCCGRV